MLYLILITQIHAAPANLPKPLLVAPNSPRQWFAPSQQQQRRQLQEQQLNQLQRQYQLKQRELDNLPPSRIDCFPLFPPVSGYPPGSSSISCRQP